MNAQGDPVDKDRRRKIMADVAIVSAVYDGYDSVKPVLKQTGIEVDWVLVADKAPADPLGWRVVVRPQPKLAAVRAAKRPKFLPWEYTDAQASIWVDAAFRITSPDFTAEALELAKPIAQWVHPWRDCLYQEGTEIVRLGMDPDGLADPQMDRYRDAGHPEHWGLWASGVIARQHTPAVKRMGAAWAREVRAGSQRDQVSQAFVLREAKLRPAALPGTHFANPWMKHEPSGRHY
jgi:hypothetical protein